MPSNRCAKINLNQLCPLQNCIYILQGLQRAKIGDERLGDILSLLWPLGCPGSLPDHWLLVHIGLCSITLCSIHPRLYSRVFSKFVSSLDLFCSTLVHIQNIVLSWSMGNLERWSCRLDYVDMLCAHFFFFFAPCETSCYFLELYPRIKIRFFTDVLSLQLLGFCHSFNPSLGTLFFSLSADRTLALIISIFPSNWLVGVWKTLLLIIILSGSFLIPGSRFWVLFSL